MMETGDIVKKWMLSILFCLFIMILFMGGTSVSYTKEALTIWFEKLVPSMFICMVMVRLFYDQQYFPFLLRPLQRGIYFLFHIDAAGFSLVFSTLLLGFPTGAVLIDEQVKKERLTAAPAKRLLYTCSFATPGFILLTCGSVLYGSLYVGLKLLLIQWLCGIVFLLLTRKQEVYIEEEKKAIPPFLSSLTNALWESGKTLYMIGGYLMLFMTVTSVLMDIIPASLALPLSVFSEFSNGILTIHTQPWPFLTQMVLTSMVLGFGGFCVHMQILGMTSHLNYRYTVYLFWRILQMLLSALFAYLIFSL